MQRVEEKEKSQLVAESGFYLCYIRFVYLIERRLKVFLSMQLVLRYHLELFSLR